MRTNKTKTKNNNIKPNKIKKTTVGVACYATQNNKQSHVGAGPVSALNGVTLPALVITIIVMLILAGVTLNLTIGERGFFKSTQELQDIQTIAEYKDRVEISRAGTAVDNLGIVTLDNLTKQIYEDKVVPEGSIRKIDDEKAQMTTPEGYVFIITADGIEYIDKEDAIPVPPDLTEGNVEFKIDPETWTNKTVKISIEQKAGDKFTIEYSTDAKEWKKYTKEIETDKNTTIYARLKNPIGVAGNYASEKITNIDKLDPIKIVPTITATTNTITIDASKASDAQATNEDGCSGIKQIYYSKDEGTTWQTNEKAEDRTYTYKELEQNKTYKIQVRIIDNATNQTITKTQEITTGQVDIAEGNVTIGAPSWNATDHTATVAISKKDTVASGLQIQYQVNSTSGTWTTGTSKSGLKLNDTVYARLWDGTNGGAYTSLKITESTDPQKATISFSDINTKTNTNITAMVTLTDNESGVNITSSKWVYNASSSAIGTDSSKYTNAFISNPPTITLNTPIFGTHYLHVLTVDNAGNKKETISSAINVKPLVNEPKLLTGMTPIKFTEPTDTAEGKVETTTTSDYNWQDYGNKKWANSRTQDGSMWVWIPRYAYRINKSTQTCDIVFLIGTTDTYYDDNGKIQTAKRAKSVTEIVDTTTGYTVHPVFTNESSINYANGGWDKELTGIWIAKFEAGYAGGNNNAPKGVASSVTYSQERVWAPSVENGTGSEASVAARNWTDGIYGATKTAIKYPTFQGITYSMNYINHNDAFNISRALTEEKNIYGFNASQTDSHLMKNSEWGAVAYLGQSQYGLNGENIYINNVNLNNSTQSVYTVTGCCGKTADAASFATTIGAINDRTANCYVWSQKEGQKASSTGTIYGIYDMSGGLWEKTAGYVANGNGELKKYGSSITYNGDKLRTTSTKYTMVYLHDLDVDKAGADLDTASKANYEKNTRIYGDAIRETSTAGTGANSWYDDYSCFPAVASPFSIRGGLWGHGSNAGLFYFNRANGSSTYNNGFRPVLVAL